MDNTNNKPSNEEQVQIFGLCARRSLYLKFFPNFTPLWKPSRTESYDSDLIIDRNGRRKKPLL